MPDFYKDFLIRVDREDSGLKLSAGKPEDFEQKQSVESAPFTFSPSEAELRERLRRVASALGGIRQRKVRGKALGFFRRVEEETIRRFGRDL